METLLSEVAADQQVKGTATTTFPVVEHSTCANPSTTSVNILNVAQEDEREETDHGLGCFEKFLTLWVALCMVIGSLMGYYIPALASGINNATINQVNLPITVLIWLMILPALVQIDFNAILEVKKHPSALFVTTCVNYAIQPFTMFGFAILFFRYAFAPYIQPPALQDQYIAGAVFLGSGPCTAMVIVWSSLVHGDAAYTLIQVALNDLLLCILYAPTVGGLIGVANLQPPWVTIILSTVFFLIIPSILAFIIRKIILNKWGPKGMNVVKKNSTVFTEVILLVMLVMIFICQGARIPGEIANIFMIAVPLLIQGFAIFALTLFFMYLARVPFIYAAPGALIGTSNFFELAVALAITIYGPQSGAALVTVVGVLTEVPSMLVLVWICKRSRSWYERKLELRIAKSDEQGQRKNHAGAKCTAGEMEEQQVSDSAIALV